MSVKLILENWADYDSRKMRIGNNSKIFSCTEYWEIDYLKNKIMQYYPALSEKNILDAIQSCCLKTHPPHPRQAFVECIAQQLNIPIK